MAVDIRRIFRVVGDISLLNAGQIGVQENPDADLGWRMHGGKDDLGTPTQWLAKDRPARVTALTMNEAQFLGETGILRHTASGGVIGGQMTVAEFNAYLSDGPISGGGATPDHNLLSGLNAGDYQHLTAANHTALTGGGSTSLHTHLVSHNILTGLNVGDYKHLTAANHTALTTGVSTSLHLHPYTGVLDTPDGRVPFGTGSGTGLSSDSAFHYDSATDRLQLGGLSVTSDPSVLGTLYGVHLGANGTGVAHYAAWMSSDWYSSDPTSHPAVSLRLSGTGTLGDHARPANSAILGRIQFYGSDGTAFTRAAYISASITENWGASARGTRLSFVTTSTGGTTASATLRLEDGHAYVNDSVIAGQSHTFSGSNGAVFGSNNINAMDYAMVSGKYARAEWDHGKFMTGFRLDGSTSGSSQGFSDLVVGQIFTSTTIGTLKLDPTDADDITFRDLEVGCHYLFEVLLTASFIGSTQTGTDNKTFLVSAYRQPGGLMENVSFVETANLGGVDATGTFSASFLNLHSGVRLRWTPVVCSATDPIEVVAIVKGVKTHYANND